MNWLLMCGAAGVVAGYLLAHYLFFQAFLKAPYAVSMWMSASLGGFLGLVYGFSFRIDGLQGISINGGGSEVVAIGLIAANVLIFIVSAVLHLLQERR